MTIKLETETIRTIAAFEKITKVHPRDCLITENCLYFLVEPGKVGMAIGKNGSIIKEVRRVFGKSVKLFPYSSDPEIMIRNIVPDAKNIEIANGSVKLSIQSKDKSTLIGKNGGNINAIREILKRHFAINELKVRI